MSSTERRRRRSNPNSSSNYVTDFTARPRREKRTFSPEQKARNAARREAIFSDPTAVSPLLDEIFQSAPTGALPNHGIPQDMQSCIEGTTSPWNAYMRCMVADEHLQLALAAMLGSDVWAEALADAVAAKGMPIATFLGHVFQLAAASQAALNSPAAWRNLYTSDKLVQKRKSRASRKYGRTYKLPPRTE